MTMFEHPPTQYRITANGREFVGICVGRIGDVFEFDVPNQGFNLDLARVRLAEIDKLEKIALCARLERIASHDTDS